MVGSNIDGFVVDYRYTGTVAGTSLGRTATHEIGHYLGLQHPWGSNTGDCQGDAGAEDDDITDTPFSSDPNYTQSSCSMTPTQCGHTIFGSNYMDYPDDACMNAFSTGQKNVMRSVLSGTASGLGFGSRAQLVNNAATTCGTPQTTCANPVTAAFTMGFETNETVTGWTSENSNSDTNTAGNAVTWAVGNTTQADGDYGPHTGAQYAAYFYNNNGTSAANDWLFSPCLTLATGKTYTLKFWYAVGSSQGVTYTEKLRVSLGTAQNSANMTVLLQDFGAVTNAYPGYQQATVTFTVATNGTYYIGFKCYSDADKYILMVDDINLTGTITSTNDVRFAQDFTVSPNPATDELVLELTDLLYEKGANITVTDIAGHTVLEQPWTTGQNKTFVYVEKIPDGLYFITLHTGGQRVTRKVIVRH
jgi:hypothetical protein